MEDWRYTEFTKYAQQIANVLWDKHNDYGVSVGRFGVRGVAIRTFDKTDRLYNLMEKTEKFEPTRDTWVDLAGYAILALMIEDKNIVFFDEDGIFRLDDVHWKKDTKWLEGIREAIENDHTLSEIIKCQRCENKSFDKYLKKCYNCDGIFREVKLEGDANRDPLETSEDSRVGTKTIKRDY